MFDIKAKINLYLAEEGGRSSATLDTHFSFRIEIGGKYFDARAILSNHGKLKPGDVVELPVKFLDPQVVLPQMRIGCKFPIWEMSQVGELEVLEFNA